jgi:hypothetical protein
MTRYLLTLEGSRSRGEAHALIERAPAGTRVEFKASKRTNEQNALMWVLLTAVSLQVPWDGRRRTPDRWKDLFMDALRAELDEEEEMLPALDGSGRRVNVGNSTSDLSKDEMGMLLELIQKFGAEHGVEFDQAHEEAA